MKPNRPAYKNASLALRQNREGFHGPEAPALRIVRARVATAWQLQRLEFSQILIRYAIGVVITVYAILSPLFEKGDAENFSFVAPLLIVAWAIGAGLLVHLLIWPRRATLRRAASICADALALSLLIHYGERSAAIFFPVYLWVILGNGYRFGIAYMYASMAANVLCFVAMVFSTPYWRQEWQFSAGLFIAIIAIPVYSSSLIRKLRLSMQQARAASTAKTEFLSMISHELRTPLNAILGLAQLSKITAASAQDRENALSTEIAAHRLTRMLDSMLKFQAVESGAGRVSMRSFSFIEMLSEIEAIVSPLAWKKKLDLNFVFATGIPQALESDPDIIQTIIINLVTNAIKYTREGYVRVSLGFGSTQAGSALRIEVRDSGPGIEPSMQARIFDRFVRHVPEGIDDEGGVGLGLSLCKSMCSLLGGEIGCMSAFGKGATFWVEIPVQCSDSHGQDHAAGTADVKLLTFGLDAKMDDNVARSFEVLQETEARVLLEDGTNCEDATLVLVANRSNLPPFEWDKLRRLREQAKIPHPVIAVNPKADASPNILGQTTAAVSEASAVSVELIRTVVEWQRRHIPHDPETLEEGELCEKTILVADDNSLNRQVICRMLKLGGCAVFEAETGDDALDELLTRTIDVAILDINMPGQDGIEVCKTYRSVASKESAAVIVGLTADISIETRSRCLEAGMFDVLSKPLALENLRAMLCRIDGTQPRTASATRKRDRQDGPVLDKERVRFLVEMFGAEHFKNSLLTAFENDTRQTIGELRLDVSQLQSSKVQNLLHAIKSSAKTIGAVRLANAVSGLEEKGSLHSTQPAACEGIAEELNAFVTSCKEAIGEHDSLH